MKAGATSFLDQIKEKDKTAIALNLVTAVVVFIIGAFTVYGFQLGIFSSTAAFSKYIISLGAIAPITFIIMQIIQVVVPVLPVAIGCVAGVFAFGPVWGLLYSYIGISLGSILAFLISKRYGLPIVRKLVNPVKLEKYLTWLEKGNAFDKLFAIAILIPVVPDDLLCYIAGLTKMKLKRFSAIILLCKPPSIAMYSLALAGVISLTGF